MIEIREFRPSEHQDSIRALMFDHWHETEDKFEDEPAPNFESYKALEEAGFVVAFAAFDGEVMVGYAVGYVLGHMHYPITHAQHDSLYLKKEYRGRTGLKLMSKLEEACGGKGANYIVWHAKVGSAFDRILRRLHGEPEENIYRKVLSCQPPSQSLQP